MRTIEEVYLIGNAPLPKFGSAKTYELGNTGEPLAEKTTPTIVRVAQSELELTYLHNPLIFNGINKIIQTIMSAEHELVCKSPEIKTYFEAYFEELGNSGSDITWEELLSQIYKFQCIYGKAWVENIFNKRQNRIVDWDLIDPKKMDYAKQSEDKIALNKFGKPIGYVETLPYDTPVTKTNLTKEAIAANVTLPPNSIFLEPRRIAQIKLFTIGDGFYPIGLIEPIYQSSLRKLNVESALANSIWKLGFPTRIAKIGDANHEPTPQQVESILNKLKDSTYKTELSIPYYVAIDILESKKAVEKLKENLEYFKENEVAGLGIPKPFVTGGGEETNRATLGNQDSMFQLTLRDIIDKTCESIRKYMFKPLCEFEGFKEIPRLKWEVTGSDELDKKTKRLIAYIKAGALEPQSIKAYIKKAEKIE